MNIIIPILAVVAALLIALGIFFRINEEKLRSLVSFAIAAAFVAASILAFVLTEEDGTRMVTVSIDNYEEDGTFAGSPCFRIWIGYIGESATLINETFTSEVFQNSMELESPFEATVVLPETVISMSFTITVFNGSPENNHIIDCDSDIGYFISRTLTSPFDGTWTSDGSDDGFEDIDCSITYSLSEHYDY